MAIALKHRQWKNRQSPKLPNGFFETHPWRRRLPETTSRKGFVLAAVSGRIRGTLDLAASLPAPAVREATRRLLDREP